MPDDDRAIWICAPCKAAMICTNVTSVTCGHCGAPMKRGIGPALAEARRDERRAILERLAACETELLHPETAEEVAAVRWRDIANVLGRDADG